MKAGLDEKGFRRKQYAEVEEDLFVRAKNLFGEDINLSVRSPLGIFLMIVAWSLSLLWQLAEQVYNQSFLRTAEGSSLDHLVELGHIRRFQAQKSRGEITIHGQANKLIREGFVVSTVSGIKYKTLRDAVISSEGTVVVPIEALEVGGEGNVAEGFIKKIINPEVGITSVMNNKQTHSGRDIESDYELRERYRLSPARGATGTGDAIRSRLLSLANVKSALVLENDTMNPVDSVPPKAIKVIVLGGLDNEIAQAILETKAAGIQTAGDTALSIPDTGGASKEIRFQRAKPLKVQCEVTITRSSEFNSDETAVKKVIKEYFSALKMGEDVIYSSLLSTVFTKISGIKDLDLSITKQGSKGSKENIEISVDEVAEVEIRSVSIV